MHWLAVFFFSRVFNHLLSLVVVAVVIAFSNQLTSGFGWIRVNMGVRGQAACSYQSKSKGGI